MTRPKLSLRFRDLDQLQRTSNLAAAAGLSLNEYILKAVDAADSETLVKQASCWDQLTKIREILRIEQ